MATVTGITVERANAIENASVVSGHVTGGNLYLVTKGGSEINAGPVGGSGSGGSAPIEAWPIGSIFMSTVATNPSQLLGGGSWARWGQGRVPVSLDTSQSEFNTVEKVGGEKTHTITTTEMPAHTHPLSSSTPHTHTVNDPGHQHPLTDPGHSHTTQLTTYQSDAGPGTSLFFARPNTPYTVNTQSSTTGITMASSKTNITLSSETLTGTIGSTGSGSPMNVMQPYITCYMWKRTS